MTQGDTVANHDRVSLLHELSIALNANPDLETILNTAVGFASQLDVSFCEIYLLAGSDGVYYRNSQSERNNISEVELQATVRHAIVDGLAAQALQTGQPILVLDTKDDPHWNPSTTILQIGSVNREYPAAIRSFICLPIIVGSNHLRGVISFAHLQPNQFDEHDLTLFRAFATQIAIALKNTSLLNDLQSSLHETHLMLDVSRRLSGALNLDDVYTALIQSIIATGADRCTLHLCDDLDADNIPRRSEVVAVGDVDSANSTKDTGYHFSIPDYPILNELVYSQETLVIGDLSAEERLTAAEKNLLQKYEAHSVVVNPLVSRGHVIGLIVIGYRTGHIFTERELALYRTLCNQTTIAIEHARQVQRTEAALAETQTLYRAGRVLAGAADLQEILQEALVEYVYSLGLDQGGVTLISPDRESGQLMAYVQEGQLQNVERLKFPLDRNIPYQQTLLSGRPFVSVDALNDPNLAGFHSFNQTGMPKSLLEAPMIIRGETIGWIGADSVNEHRYFTQQEIDLARAMADQIAITIQNRRLLEQTERRASRLKAAAKVGESISRMLDLGEIFNTTVELIRDRFGFYHVSIFLLDDNQDWAVVHASTGDVGKIMVEKPHRLKVGSNSIVGYVTANAQPRIALDVGGDAVHFQNPLLPETRSEMALPLLTRGIVIGALDVQSTEVNAFSEEDIDTLQIMADQLSNAIENARLLQSAQDSRLFMKSIIDQIPDPIFIKDKEHRWVVVNRAFTEGILDLPEEKVIGRTDYDYLPKEEADWLWAQDSKMFEIGQAQETEETITDAAGSIRTLYTRKIPLMDEDGKPEYLIGIVNDITERKRSEEALAKRAIELEESQNFLNSVIDNIPSMLFVKEAEELRFVHWNKTGEELHELSRDQVLGKNDYDLVPKEQADFFTSKDREVLTSGKLLDIPEEPLYTRAGTRLLHTRKVPVFGADGKPKYLLGISEDITERKQAEEALQAAFDRTQSLYRISDALATAVDQQTTTETILGEYLRLLNLKQGVLALLDSTEDSYKVQALYVESQPVKFSGELPYNEEVIIQYLTQNPTPLLIDNVHNHALTKDNQEIRNQMEAMLVIPINMRDKVVGFISANSSDKNYTFSQNNIDIGEAITDQLSIWLENHQLLVEAQYRTNRLRTAAEVSRAASSILDTDELIHTSVNLIRDQFGFYYVGLFLVDEAREWAVLRAGTGEAGRLQIEKKHRLKIGGESMIGWCIENRQARIALDVGQEAVRFQNPFLPDTHSEMALPLISRKEVIGALTVQSIERGAFSAEDITLLQTMADQLANALENARLFAQTQKALWETEILYRVFQELLSARDEETVYRLAMEAVAQSGIDSASVFIYSNNRDTDLMEQILEQKAIWTATDDVSPTYNTRFKASEVVIEELIPQHGALVIEDTSGNDPRVTDHLRRELTLRDIKALAAFPLSTYQSRLGFLLVTYKTQGKLFTPQQIRFFNTIAQQMVVALENLRLLDASQRRVRREEIIREISSKIRGSTNVEDILKTTVTELSKVLGAAQGGILLGVNSPSPLTEHQALSQAQGQASDRSNLEKNKAELVGNTENKTHGQ